MVDMIICGLSMEMRAAEEAGHVGKCKGCLYTEHWENDTVFCIKKGKRIKEREDCKEWVVDHR